MKIAILTIPPRLNFGGILQAYALQTVLERNGHDVIVLDKPHERKLPAVRAFLAYAKRIILKFVLKKKIRIFEEKYYNETYPIVSQNTQYFIDKYLHTREIKSLFDIQERDYDAFVVGSDQIWRRKYNKNIKNSFLFFARKWNVGRYAYAASFGTDRWEYSERERKICSMLLKKFAFVGVREENGKELCEKFLGKCADVVLDPTLLLSKDDYISLMDFSKSEKYKGKLVCYILDENEEKKRLINEVSLRLGLPTIMVNAKWSINEPLSARVQPSVEEWLTALASAAFVITDSFHGTVFSILFERKFLTIGNESRGLSRMESLLALFGLQDKLVTDFNQYDLDESAIKKEKYEDFKKASLMHISFFGKEL